MDGSVRRPTSKPRRTRERKAEQDGIFLCKRHSPCAHYAAMVSIFSWLNRGYSTNHVLMLIAPCRVKACQTLNVVSLQQCYSTRTQGRTDFLHSNLHATALSCLPLFWISLSRVAQFPVCRPIEKMSFNSTLDTRSIRVSSCST